MWYTDLTCGFLWFYKCCKLECVLSSMTQSCDSHLEYHPGHIIEPPRFLLTMTQRSSPLPTLPRISTNITAFHYILEFHLHHQFFSEQWKECSKVSLVCLSTLMTSYGDQENQQRASQESGWSSLSTGTIWAMPKALQVYLHAPFHWVLGTPDLGRRAATYPRAV